MITEANYMELMKNCSKWNTRVHNERKTRCRVPFYDHQTGTAHRPIPNYYKTKEQRMDSNDPNVVVQYPAPRWKRQGHQPFDAVEMKMFLRDNPALDQAVNQSNQVAAMAAVPQEFLMAEIVSHGSPAGSKGTPKPNIFEDFVDELDDDASAASGSDEDDWGAKRKKGKAASLKKKKASAAGRPREPHACSKCGAKYKSLAGLTYHSAYVHHELSTSTTNKLLSPNIEVNDYCDLCLGDRFKNKNTNKAEDLVVCHDCGRAGHPSCLSFNENVPKVINRYGWQCIECKSCTICGTSENDDQLLFCDDCDRGYHLYCLRPPLKKAPDNEYSCSLCQREFGAAASAPAKR